MNLDLILPAKTKPADVFRFATVTSESPLRVRLDGDAVEASIKPISLVLLEVGDRVLAQLHHKQLIILGRVNGDSGHVFNVRSYGADNKGVNDNTAVLQKVMDAIDQAGGGIMFFPAGTYIVDGTVTLASNVHISGADATIKKTTGSTNYVTFLGLAGTSTGYGSGKNNLILEGLTFEGDLGNSVSMNALSLHKSSNVRVRNCKFLQCVQNGHVLDLMGCDDVIIENSEFLGSKLVLTREYTEFIQADSSMRIGVGWDYAEFGGETFDGTPSKNITVRGCTFGPLTVGGVTYDAACPFGTHTYVQAKPFTGLRFLNNKVSRVREINDSASYYGMLHFTGARDVLIQGNEFDADGHYQCAVRFYRGAGAMTLATVGSTSPSYSDTNPMTPSNIRILDNIFTGFSDLSTAKNVLEVYGFSDTAPATNISIRGNHFRDNWPSGTVTGTQCATMIDASYVQNFDVMANEAYRMRRFFTVRNGNAVRADHNGITDTATSPMTFTDSEAISCSHNTIRGWANPIYFYTCSVVAVHGNTHELPASTGATGARGFNVNGCDGASLFGNIGKSSTTTTAPYIRVEAPGTNIVAVGNVAINYTGAVTTEAAVTLAYSAGNIG